jgi:hypothetical protein
MAIREDRPRHDRPVAIQHQRCKDALSRTRSGAAMPPDRALDPTIGGIRATGLEH